MSEPKNKCYILSLFDIKMACRTKDELMQTIFTEINNLEECESLTMTISTDEMTDEEYNKLAEFEGF